MKTLIVIGYWSSDDGPSDYPDPTTLVNPHWDFEAKSKIATYLKLGIRFRGYWGHSYCRFDKERSLGTFELTDGVYAWPEGLATYVEEFGVMLPDEFVAHAESMKFQIPRELPAERFRTDDTFWKQWSAKMNPRANQ